MTTSKYLSQIKEFDIKIDRKIAEKNRLREIATSTGGTGDGERVQTSIKRDKLGDTVAKIIDTEKEIDHLIDIYVAKKQEIIKQIDQVEDMEQYEILHLYFIDGYTMKECAKFKDCSIRKVNATKANAMKTFEKMFGKLYYA